MGSEWWASHSKASGYIYAQESSMFGVWATLGEPLWPDQAEQVPWPVDTFDTALCRTNPWCAWDFTPCWCHSLRLEAWKHLVGKVSCNKNKNDGWLLTFITVWKLLTSRWLTLDQHVIDHNACIHISSLDSTGLLKFSLAWSTLLK